MLINIKDMDHSPSIEEISTYIGIPLFQEFCEYMEAEYKAVCKIEYSKDVWVRGWNVKFKKAGRSLCVVYPKDKFFTVLVVVGNKERESVENLLPRLSGEIQKLYYSTKESNGQRWLMIDLNAKDCIYHDILKLIRIRRESK